MQLTNTIPQDECAIHTSRLPQAICMHHRVLVIVVEFVDTDVIVIAMHALLDIALVEHVCETKDMQLQLDGYHLQY